MAKGRALEERTVGHRLLDHSSLAPRGASPRGPSRAYFPLVGLALGTILAGLDFAARQALPSPVVGALLVVALLVLTRAIHTEGFLDTCDGLFGGYSQAERLEILRDTHVGAFAVVGGVGLLMLKWTALVGISDEIRAGLLTTFPCMSRFWDGVYDGCLRICKEAGDRDNVPSRVQLAAGRLWTRYHHRSGWTASWSRRVAFAGCDYRRVFDTGLVD